MIKENPKLLCLFSTPLVDNKGEAITHLNYQREKEAILNELTPLNKEISIRTRFATIGELNKGMGDEFNILHLSGHGDEKHLLFEDMKGKAHYLKGEFIKEIIQRNPCFKLAVVSACHSENIGGMLIEAGVNHVIAIRLDSPVLDYAATTFIREFFASLLGGKTINGAFEDAKIMLKSDAENMELKPHLEYEALWEKRSFIPEEEKFVLLPKERNRHDIPLFSNIPDGSPLVESTLESGKNLPVKSENFMGRSKELYEIALELGSKRLVTITGAGGIGKTTVAMEVCRWLSERNRFPDGIYWLNVRNIKNVESLLSDISVMFKEKFEKDCDLSDFLSEKDCLIYLDNCEGLILNEGDLFQQFIHHVLMFTKKIKFLITSQRQVGGNLYSPESIFHLSPFSYLGDSSIKLFLDSSSRKISPNEYINEDGKLKDDFITFMKSLGGHPLSIIIMARQLINGVEIYDLSGRLEKYKNKAIKMPGVNGREHLPAESLDACLSMAYDNLSDRTKKCFHCLSLLPAGIYEELLKEFLGVGGDESIRELNEVSLIEITSMPIFNIKRVSLLPPVLLFAENKITQDEREGLEKSLLLLLVPFLHEIHDNYRNENALISQIQFSIEEPNFRRAANFKSSPKKNKQETSMLGLLAPPLMNLYLYEHRLKDCQLLGKEILPRFDQLNDYSGKANTLQAIGDLCLRKDELDEAKEAYEEAKEIFSKINEQLGKANIDLRLSFLATLIGSSEKIPLIDEAEITFDKIGDNDGRSECKMVRAFINVLAGDLSKGDAYLKECLVIREKTEGFWDLIFWLLIIHDFFMEKTNTAICEFALRHAKACAEKTNEGIFIEQVLSRMKKPQ